jgi:hypothetical protein
LSLSAGTSRCGARVSMTSHTVTASLPRVVNLSTRRASPRVLKCAVILGMDTLGLGSVGAPDE